MEDNKNFQAKKKPRRRNKQGEEEKYNNKGHHFYVKKHPKIRSSREDGFTGHPDNWFDGKT